MHAPHSASTERFVRIRRGFILHYSFLCLYQEGHGRKARWARPMRDKRLFSTSSRSLALCRGHNFENLNAV